MVMPVFIPHIGLFLATAKPLPISIHNDVSYFCKNLPIHRVFLT